MLHLQKHKVDEQNQLKLSSNVSLDTDDSCLKNQK